MSFLEDYADAHDPCYGEPHQIPLKIASEETLKGYGRVVRDFENEVVEITTWPQQGWRHIDAGTGNQGGVAVGDFEFEWSSDVMLASNTAVNRRYVTGRLPANESHSNRKHVLIREVNYHPDGGQVFYPQNGESYVVVLALPGDDVKMEDFVAFYMDGSFGIQIHAGIWHQSPYPINDKATCKGKQGKVHACVTMDFVKEFSKYMLVPLTKS